MLVLTRKLQEQIRIGDNITITILRVKGRSVRVGIEAPRDVRLVRGELPELADESASTEPEIAESEITESEVTEQTTHYTVTDVLDDSDSHGETAGDSGMLARRGSLSAMVSSVRQRQGDSLVHTL